MSCEIHQKHQHVHDNDCGHTKILHNGHIDYLHDGHLHNNHSEHVDEHTIELSESNKVECIQVKCGCDHKNCGHEKIPHDDHFDFIVKGRLHHPHGDHCDDHGAINIVV